MQKKNLPFSEIAILTAGEIIVSLIVIGIYLAIDKFSYQIVTGAILGSFVTIFNFIFLSVSVNRAIDKVMAIRGDQEMNEEEAEKFAAEHSAQIQNAVKGSYLLRMLLMLAALVAAFLFPNFVNVIATLVPLLMFRPILTIGEFFRKKKEGDQ